MKTSHYEKKWIWENKNFPNFIYEKQPLEELFYKFGNLNMIDSFINPSNSKEFLSEILINEVVSTSAIEGELLQRSSVRSSINKLLKLDLEDDSYDSTIQSDALVQIILDTKNNDAKLDKKRLCSWHKALFPTGQSGLKEIIVGEYRKDIEDMQIVSGSWEKEKIHYIAPKVKDVPKLMDDFLTWLNEENETNYIYKSIIAHLYFLLIHPFDDGNGRIARAICDYVLAQGKLANADFYSISSSIHTKRKEYYQVLDNACITTNLDTNPDISQWIKWNIKLYEESIDSSLEKVNTVKTKANFYSKHQDKKLNDRQKKVIQKMLDSLPLEFEGGMKVKKYMNITKSTRVTANRDLTNLIELNIMQKHGLARATFYTLVL